MGFVNNFEFGDSDSPSGSSGRRLRRAEDGFRADIEFSATEMSGSSSGSGSGSGSDSTIDLDVNVDIAAPAMITVPFRTESFMAATSTNPTVQLRLSSRSALVPGPNGPMLTIKLSQEDLWRVKNEPSLLSGAARGYATIDSNSLYDMAVTPNRNPELSAPVRQIVLDGHSPGLSSYSIDLIEGTIAMTFDEPVNPTSLSFTSVTVHSDVDASTSLSSRAMLPALSAVTTTTGTQLIVDMRDEDLAILQRDMQLATRAEDTYISFGSDMVSDMAIPANEVKPRAASTGLAAADVLYYDYAMVHSIGPDAGVSAGGTTITIRGSGFAQYTLRAGSRYDTPLPVEVHVGGVAATAVTVVNDTMLTCVTPAPGTSTTLGVPAVVTVEVDSALFTNFTGFTYLIPPTLTSIRPIAGPLTGGTRVTMKGTHFGKDHSTGSGAYVGATFNGREATGCVVIDGDLVCHTPAGLSSAEVSVVARVDGSLSGVLADAFTYLNRPTVSIVDPPSGSADRDTPITITGTNFGPLTSTGNAPPVEVRIGTRVCEDLAVVAGANGSEQITCVVPAGHGPDQLVVDVDGTTSTETFVFTDFNDAGVFTFNSSLYTVVDRPTPASL